MRETYLSKHSAIYTATVDDEVCTTRYVQLCSTTHSRMASSGVGTALLLRRRKCISIPLSAVSPPSPINTYRCHPQPIRVLQSSVFAHGAT